jgi:tRNA A37 methylthiotransferase MiaB
MSEVRRWTIRVCPEHGVTARYLCPYSHHARTEDVEVAPASDLDAALEREARLREALKRIAYGPQKPGEKTVAEYLIQAEDIARTALPAQPEEER